MIRCQWRARVSGAVAIVALVIVSGALVPIGAQEEEPPEDVCPEVPTLPLRVATSTSGSEVVQHWAVTTCQEDIDVPLSVMLGNSPGARMFTMMNTSTVGITSRAITPEEIAAFEALVEFNPALEPYLGRRYVYAPIAVSALACPFSVFYRSTELIDVRVNQMNLSPLSLAGLGNALLGNLLHEPIALDNVDNSELPRLPNGFPRPKDFRFVGRADSSHATYLLTSYFYSDPAAKAMWEKDERFVTGPTENFPADEGVNLKTGAGAVAEELRAIDNGERVRGAVGCIDTSIAADALPTLPLASLKNPAGRFVQPTIAAMTAALGTLTEQDDGTFLPKFTAPGYDPAAYPLPVVSYAVIPTSGLTDLEEDQLRAFLEYTIGPGQSNLPPGYVKLTPRMVELAAAAIDEIGTDDEQPGEEEPPPVNENPPGVDNFAAPFTTDFGDFGTSGGLGVGGVDGVAGGPGGDGAVAAVAGRSFGDRVLAAAGSLPFLGVMIAGLLLLVGGPLVLLHQRGYLAPSRIRGGLDGVRRRAFTSEAP